MSYIFSSATLNLGVNSGQFLKDISTAGTRTDKALVGMQQSALAFESSWGKLTAGIKDTKRIVSGILVSQTFYAITRGLTAAAAAATTFSMSMETANISLKYFAEGAQKAEKAAAFLRELNTFAARTPFSTEDVLGIAKYMQAVGISMKASKSMLKVITDTAAATGATNENMQRIIFGLGQMKTKGRIANEEIRQLANANIPIYEILNEELGLTGAQISKIGKYWVGADKAVVAILRGLEKRYKGAADEVADTMTGMVDTVLDNTKILSQILGKGIYDTAAEKMEKLRDTLDKFREIGTEKGSGGVLFEILKGLNTGGLNATGTAVLALVGNVRQLLAAFQGLTASAKPLVSIFRQSFYASITVSMYVLTAFAKTAGWLLTQLNKLGLSVPRLTAALTTLFIAYKAAKWIALLGQAGLAAALRMVNLASSAWAIVPAFAKAHAATFALASGLAMLLAYGLSVYGMFKLINSSAAGLDSSSSNAFGLPDDYMDAYAEYEAKMKEYNEAIARHQEEFNAPFSSIDEGSDKAIDAIDAVEKKSKKSAKAVKSHWLAAFDEVFAPPEETPDDGGTAALEDTLGDLAGLLSAPIFKFPSSIGAELVMPEFDWDKVYDSSWQDSDVMNGGWWKAMIPFALFAAAPKLASIFSKSFRGEAEKNVHGEAGGDGTPGKVGVKDYAGLTGKELLKELRKLVISYAVLEEELKTIQKQLADPKISDEARRLAMAHQRLVVASAEKFLKPISDIQDLLEIPGGKRMSLETYNTSKQSILLDDIKESAKAIEGLQADLLGISNKSSTLAKETLKEIGTLRKSLVSQIDEYMHIGGKGLSQDYIDSLLDNADTIQTRLVNIDKAAAALLTEFRSGLGATTKVHTDLLNIKNDLAGVVKLIEADEEIRFDTTDLTSLVETLEKYTTGANEFKIISRRLNELIGIIQDSSTPLALKQTAIDDMRIAKAQAAKQLAALEKIQGLLGIPKDKGVQTNDFSIANNALAFEDVSNTLESIKTTQEKLLEVANVNSVEARALSSELRSLKKTLADQMEAYTKAGGVGLSQAEINRVLNLETLALERLDQLNVAAQSALKLIRNDTASVDSIYNEIATFKTNLKNILKTLELFGTTELDTSGIEYTIDILDQYAKNMQLVNKTQAALSDYVAELKSQGKSSLDNLEYARQKKALADASDAATFYRTLIDATDKVRIITQEQASATTAVANKIDALSHNILQELKPVVSLLQQLETYGKHVYTTTTGQGIIADTIRSIEKTLKANDAARLDPQMFDILKSLAMQLRGGKRITPKAASVISTRLIQNLIGEVTNGFNTLNVSSEKVVNGLDTLYQEIRKQSNNPYLDRAAGGDTVKVTTRAIGDSVTEALSKPIDILRKQIYRLADEIVSSQAGLAPFTDLYKKESIKIYNKLAAIDSTGLAIKGEMTTLASDILAVGEQVVHDRWLSENKSFRSDIQQYTDLNLKLSRVTEEKLRMLGGSRIMSLDRQIGVQQLTVSKEVAALFNPVQVQLTSGNVTALTQGADRFGQTPPKIISDNLNFIMKDIFGVNIPQTLAEINLHAKGAVTQIGGGSLLQKTLGDIGYTLRSGTSYLDKTGKVMAEIDYVMSRGLETISLDTKLIAKSQEGIIRVIRDTYGTTDIDGIVHVSQEGFEELLALAPEIANGIATQAFVLGKGTGAIAAIYETKLPTLIAEIPNAIRGLDITLKANADKALAGLEEIAATNFLTIRALELSKNADVIVFDIPTSMFEEIPLLADKFIELQRLNAASLAAGYDVAVVLHQVIDKQGVILGKIDSVYSTASITKPRTTDPLLEKYFNKVLKGINSNTKTTRELAFNQLAKIEDNISRGVKLLGDDKSTNLVDILVPESGSDAYSVARITAEHANELLEQIHGLQQDLLGRGFNLYKALNSQIYEINSAVSRGVQLDEAAFVSAKGNATTLKELLFMTSKTAEALEEHLGLTGTTNNLLSKQLQRYAALSAGDYTPVTEKFSQQFDMPEKGIGLGVFAEKITTIAKENTANITNLTSAVDRFLGTLDTLLIKVEKNSYAPAEIMENMQKVIGELAQNIADGVYPTQFKDGTSVTAPTAADLQIRGIKEILAGQSFNMEEYVKNTFEASEKILREAVRSFIDSGKTNKQIIEAASKIDDRILDVTNIVEDINIKISRSTPEKPITEMTPYTIDGDTRSIAGWRKVVRDRLSQITDDLQKINNTGINITNAFVAQYDSQIAGSAESGPIPYIEMEYKLANIDTYLELFAETTAGKFANLESFIEKIKVNEANILANSANVVIEKVVSREPSKKLDDIESYASTDKIVNRYMEFLASKITDPDKSRFAYTAIDNAVEDAFELIREAARQIADEGVSFENALAELTTELTSIADSLHSAPIFKLSDTMTVEEFANMFIDTMSKFTGLDNNILPRPITFEEPVLPKLEQTPLTKAEFDVAADALIKEYKYTSDSQIRAYRAIQRDYKLLRKTLIDGQKGAREAGVTKALRTAAAEMGSVTKAFNKSRAEREAIFNTELAKLNALVEAAPNKFARAQAQAQQSIERKNANKEIADQVAKDTAAKVAADKLDYINKVNEARGTPEKPSTDKGALSELTQPTPTETTFTISEAVETTRTAIEKLGAQLSDNSGEPIVRAIEEATLDIVASAKLNSASNVTLQIKGLEPILGDIYNGLLGAGGEGAGGSVASFTADTIYGYTLEINGAISEPIYVHGDALVAHINTLEAAVVDYQAGNVTLNVLGAADFGGTSPTVLDAILGQSEKQFYELIRQNQQPSVVPGMQPSTATPGTPTSPVRPGQPILHIPGVGTFAYNSSGLSPIGGSGNIPLLSGPSGPQLPPGTSSTGGSWTGTWGPTNGVGGAGSSTGGSGASGGSWSGEAYNDFDAAAEEAAGAAQRAFEAKTRAYLSQIDDSFNSALHYSALDPALLTKQGRQLQYQFQQQFGKIPDLVEGYLVGALPAGSSIDPAITRVISEKIAKTVADKLVSIGDITGKLDDVVAEALKVNADLPIFDTAGAYEATLARLQFSAKGVPFSGVTSVDDIAKFLADSLLDLPDHVALKISTEVAKAISGSSFSSGELLGSMDVQQIIASAYADLGLDIGSLSAEALDELTKATQGGIINFINDQSGAFDLAKVAAEGQDDLYKSLKSLQNMQRLSKAIKYGGYAAMIAGEAYYIYKENKRVQKINTQRNQTLDDFITSQKSGSKEYLGLLDTLQAQGLKPSDLASAGGKAGKFSLGSYFDAGDLTNFSSSEVLNSAGESIVSGIIGIAAVKASSVATAALAAWSVAKIGAIAGTVVNPGIGTAIGAVAGLVVGTVASVASNTVLKWYREASGGNTNAVRGNSAWFRELEDDNIYNNSLKAMGTDDENATDAQRKAAREAEDKQRQWYYAKLVSDGKGTGINGYKKQEYFYGKSGVGKRKWYQSRENEDKELSNVISQLFDEAPEGGWGAPSTPNGVRDGGYANETDLDTFKYGLDYIFKGGHYTDDVGMELVGRLKADSEVWAKLRKSEYGLYIEAYDALGDFVDLLNAQNGTNFVLTDYQDDTGGYGALLESMVDMHQDTQTILGQIVDASMAGTVGTTVTKAGLAYSFTGDASEADKYKVEELKRTIEQIGPELARELGMTLSLSEVKYDSASDKTGADTTSVIMEASYEKAAVLENLSGWTVTIPDNMRIDNASLTATDLEILAMSGIQINGDGTVTYMKAANVAMTGTDRETSFDYNSLSKDVVDALKKGGLDFSVLQNPGGRVDNGPLVTGFVIDPEIFRKSMSGALFNLPGGVDHSRDAKPAAVQSAISGLGKIDAETGMLEITNKSVLAGTTTIEQWMKSLGTDKLNAIPETIKKDFSKISAQISSGKGTIAQNISTMADGIIIPALIPESQMSDELAATLAMSGITVTKYGGQLVWVVNHMGDNLKKGVTYLTDEAYNSMSEAGKLALETLANVQKTATGYSVDISKTMGSMYNKSDIDETKGASGAFKTLGITYETSGEGGSAPITAFFKDGEAAIDGFITVSKEKWKLLDEEAKDALSKLAVTSVDGVSEVTLDLNNLISDGIGSLVELILNTPDSWQTLPDGFKDMLVDMGLVSQEGFIILEAGMMQGVLNIQGSLFEAWKDVSVVEWLEQLEPATRAAWDAANFETTEGLLKVSEVIEGADMEALIGQHVLVPFAQLPPEIQAKLLETNRNAKDQMYALQTTVSGSFNTIKQSISTALGTAALIAGEEMQKISDAVLNAMISMKQLDNMEAKSQKSMKGNDTPSVVTYEDSGKGTYIFRYNNRKYTITKGVDLDTAYARASMEAKGEGNALPDIGKQRPVPKAAGGIIDSHGLYEVGEYGRKEGIIPLENRLGLQIVGSAIANHVNPSSFGRPQEGLGDSIRQYSEMIAIHPKFMEQFQELRNIIGRQNELVANSVRASGSTVGNSVVAAIEEMKSFQQTMAQSTPQNNEAIKQPLLVGTLIADDRGLRDLERRMYDIQQIDRSRGARE